MGTDHRVRRPSVFILWLALSLSLLSICRGDVRDFVTQDIFDKIVYGTVMPVEDIDTENFFNGILSGASDNCAGKTFYTYTDFINGSNDFSSFNTTGTPDDQGREFAAFFANVAHETGSLCYVEEISKSNSYCDSTNTQYPCASGQQYYGRGPLQLTGNANYGAAGSYLGVDLLNNPGLVAQNDIIAWKTALWYWNVASDCHSAIISGKGFGATIQAINGAIECNGGNTDEVNDRISYYIKYCTQLGVDPGSNLRC